MDAVVLSSHDIGILRAISRAEFRYQATKKIAEAASWRIVDDEVDLGYAAFEMRLGPQGSVRRRLAIEVKESGRPVLAFVPLFYFDEYESQREPFDRAFHSSFEHMTEFLGAPLQTGEYTYGHRPNWPHSFAWWSLSNVTVVLVQDEFDIQFGMDLTLWILPPDAAVKLPVSGALEPPKEG